MQQRILSIGGGNMGRAIIGGLLQKDYPRELLSVVEPLADTRADLALAFDVKTYATADSLAATDIVVLAVKPQIMRAVVEALAPLRAEHDPLFVSIAAGITTTQLDKWLGGSAAIVRVMPNTPSLIGRGACAMFATPNTTTPARAAALSIMQAVGLALWVDREKQLDAVTALSGSGPAYFFLILEILEKVGAELGLDAELARSLAIETAHGAALLARDADVGPGVLREQVTSPGGTTQAALEVLQAGDIEGLLRRALGAADARSRELAKNAE